VGGPAHGGGFRWEDTYPARFPSLVARTLPVPVLSAQCLFLNEPLASEWGLPLDPTVWAQWGSGHQVPPEFTPWAMAYAGHQFGHFTVLGDGRAVMLGERVGPDQRRADIQLKGSGKTPFSRRGDGRAALGPMLREALISEAMHGLGIPTTRTLAVVGTGDTVWRGEPLQGAILTRLAASHIRVGTFEYVAHTGDLHTLRDLWAYVCDRHDVPLVAAADGGVLNGFSILLDRQLDLVMHWLRVGFIHGVMNTDNMALSGETIDYGPCAFMDAYDPLAVYSSIDHQGRYAWMRQPDVVIWNMARLADTILPLVHPHQPTAIERVSECLSEAASRLESRWVSMMKTKCGWVGDTPDDLPLLRALGAMMATHDWDYTQTFYDLTRGRSALWMGVPEGPGWWQAHCDRQQMGDPAQVQAMMQAANPVVIPRNHVVAAVLKDAEMGNLAPLHRFYKVLQTPYADGLDAMPYQRPPLPHERITQTFCGT